MSTHSRSTRRAATLVVVLLLPAVVGVVLLASLHGRTERISAVAAAVVNADQVVTTGTGPDATTVAAGRLLAADLTAPAPGTDVGFDWELTDAGDAARGLADGSYAAVLTIPSDFSAAVSSAGTDSPVQATVQVQGDDARSAVTALVADQVARSAAAAMGQQVTSSYLDDVYLGFNQISDEMTQAADGAQQAADGSASLASGTGQLAAGADGLAAGSAQVGSGAAALAAGAGTLSGGAAQVAAGAGALAGATGQVATGAGSVADGAAQLAAALDAVDQRAPEIPDRAAGLDADADALAALSGTLPDLAAACAAGDAAGCDALVAAVGGAGTVGGPSLRGLADRVAERAAGIAGASGPVVDGLDRLAADADALAAGSARVAAGAQQSAAGAASLATGAAGVADGAAELSTGASALADGAARSASGAAEVAGGARSAADGAASLSSGVGQLASGLTTGAQQVPTYDDDQRSALTSVVPQPVVARETTAPLDAQDAVTGPLVLPVALWLGALAALLVLPAVPRRAAYEPAGAGRVAVRAWLPVAGVAGAGALLLVLALPLLGIRAQNPLGAALVAVAAAAASAAVNQALVALWGRAGLVVSLAFLALQAASVGALVPLATAPSFFRAVHGVLPVPQAAEALGVLLLGLDGSWLRPVLGLLAWALGGLVVTALVVRRARTRVPVRDLTAVRTRVLAGAVDRAA
jgi:putative membrane protein